MASPGDKTRLLLVWPAVAGAQLHGFLPLGLGYLAANLPDGCEARLSDGVLSRRPNAEVADEAERFQPHAVGLSVWHFNLPGAREAIAAIRQRFPSLPILAGGPTVSGLGTRLFETLDADYGFVGEGEWSLPQFLGLLRRGELTDAAKRAVPGLVFRDAAGAPAANPPRWEPLDALKPCDYEFIRLDAYLAAGYRYGLHRKARRIAPIHTTRGCPFPCEYCSARLISGTRVRTRPVESVVAEIRRLHERLGIDGFNLIDDNFTFHQDYAKALCRAILGMGLKGVSFCAPNGIKVEYLDRELLGLMKQAGWQALFIAPESGSERTLERMRKKVHLPTVREKLALIREAGLKVFGFFILGYPGETADDFRQTIAFACRNAFDWATFTCFQPLPGTPVCERLIAEGEIAAAPEGVDYYQVTYAPRGFTVREMRRWRLWALLRFYTSSPRRLAAALASYSPLRILRFLLKLR
ncbi:MAG TPA: radical SAM protein [Planctomycetota bacterium]|nr:radical SAM protein [Planctomycetota bacterium]HRR82536.1 radical SAM protein [Planctomycetota bacterium]HRT96320.1 radical SAM protein [Planctomycetota bacterium]